MSNLMYSFIRKEGVVATPVNIVWSSWNFQRSTFLPRGTKIRPVFVKIQKFENGWHPTALRYEGERDRGGMCPRVPFPSKTGIPRRSKFLNFYMTPLIGLSTYHVSSFQFWSSHSTIAGLDIVTSSTISASTGVQRCPVQTLSCFLK